jgi:hypothetical protein
MDLRETSCEMASQFIAFENKSNWQVNLDMTDDALNCTRTRGVLGERVSGDYFASTAFNKDFQSNSEKLNKVNTVTEARGALK